MPLRAQELKVEVAVLSFPVPTNPRGRKATLRKKKSAVRELKELCVSRGGRLGCPVPNSPRGLCGHRTTLEAAALPRPVGVPRV